MYLLHRRLAFQTDLYFFDFTDGWVGRCDRIVSEDGLVTVTNQRWPSFAVTHRPCLWTKLWRFYMVNLQLGWLMKPGVPELEPENAKNISRVALVNTPLMKVFVHILWIFSFSGNYYISVCKYIVWHSFNYRTLKIFLIQSSATTIIIQIKFSTYLFSLHLNRWYNYHVYLNRKTADDRKGSSLVQRYLRQFV